MHSPRRLTHPRYLLLMAGAAGLGLTIRSSATASLENHRPAAPQQTQTIAPAASFAALDLLKQARDHYQGLAGFSMRIEHHNSSGLFPGEYVQTLRWSKGGRFELLVTSPNNTQVPAFYADGTNVLWIRPDGRRETRDLAPQPNTSPGWEVSAGLILSWLQKTESGTWVIQPPKGFDLAWSVGTRTEWQKQKVRELVASMKGKKHLSLFIEERTKALIGVEADPSLKLGWARYTEQKDNPTLPKTLGNPPPHK